MVVTGAEDHREDFSHDVSTVVRPLAHFADEADEDISGGI